MAQHQKMQQQMHMRNNMANRHMFQQRMVQQQQQQVQQQFQPPHQFTKQAVDVKKDNEKLQNDQQRITSLHSKLHKEAEKIRQWKTEKEMEIKQKERSLSDAIQTIDSLRKSILELQFQNEEFSGKLHTKQIEKEETEQKLVTVREMANVLRDQMVHLENRISRGEQDKEDINEVNRKMLEDNQSLVLKFQELDINQASLIEKQKKVVHSIEEAYEVKIKDMGTNIRHLENQVISLIETKTKQEQSIQEYSKKLKENINLLDQLKKEVDDFDAKNKENEKVMFTQEQSLIKSNSALEEISEKFQECSASLSELSKKYEETESEKEAQQKHAAEVEAIYMKEMDSLQSDLKEMTSKMELKDNEIKTLSEEKDENSERINHLMESGKLSDVQCQQLVSEMQKQEEDISNLRIEKETLISEMRNLQGSLEEAENKLKDLTKSSKELQQKYDLNLEELKEIIYAKEVLQAKVTEINEKLYQVSVSGDEKENVMQSYAEQITSLNKEKCEQIEAIKKLEKIREETEKTISELIIERDSYQKESNTLAYTIGNKDKEIVELSTALQAGKGMIKSLNETIELQENQLSALAEKENETSEVMKTELADQEKKAEDLGNKSKSLQSQLNVKSKQIKNMEKESKTLKTQLKKQTDKCIGFEELNLKVQEESKALEEQISELNKTLETTQSELDAAKGSFDREQKDFCETLNQYKLENDKIVEGYLKENQMLKSQNEEIQSSLKEEIETLRAEYNESNAVIEEEKKLIEELQISLKSSSNKDSRISELESLLTVVKNDLKSESEKLVTAEEEHRQKIEEMQIMMSYKETEIKQLQDDAMEFESIVQEEKQQRIDHMVPTTPKLIQANTNPVTPQSILRCSQSNRGKRVLFTGLQSSPMQTEDIGLPKTKTAKTPTINTLHKEKIKGIVKPNIRFSPKPSPGLIKELEKADKEEEENRLKIARISRKPTEKSNVKITSKPQVVNNLLKAHSTAAKDSPSNSKKNIYDRSKSPVSRVQKLDNKKVGSPGDVNRSAMFKNKMKKVAPKIRKSQDNTLSWFGFDE